MGKIKVVLFIVLALTASHSYARTWQSYARTWHVAVTGDDGNEGTAARPFRTISKGAEMAQPGDTVLVQGGVYRERVAPPRGGVAGRPIVYMAASGEKVYVKGSDVWAPDWKAMDAGNSLYKAGLAGLRFDGFNPYKTEISMFELMAASSFYKHAMNAQGDAANNIDKDIKVHATEKYTLGQVFVNGMMLTEMLNEDEVAHKQASWAYIKTEDAICVHFPEGVSPGDALVELTTRNRIFAPHLRGLGYINVAGFIFEHCANDAICLPHMVKDHPELATGQQGAVSTRSGHHWVIEDNTIRYTKTVGMDIGLESTGQTLKDYEAMRYPAPPRKTVGFHLIRNNIVSDNGIAGIVGIEFNDTRVLDNCVERNNLLLYTGNQHAGIKILLCNNCEVSGNLVRDNECFGIWLDNQVDNAVVRDNVVLHNRRAGIFYEIGKGPVLIEHNMIGYTRRSIKYPFAPGIMLSDARGITVRNNTVFNNDDIGLRIRLIPGRKSSFPTQSGFTEARNIVITGNRFYQNVKGFIEMPYHGPLAEDIRIDSNSYSGAGCFGLSASGEKQQAAGKNGDGQKEKILAEYRRSFGKDAVVTDSSKSAFRWSIGLSFAEWQVLTGSDRNSALSATGKENAGGPSGNNAWARTENGGRMRGERDGRMPEYLRGYEQEYAHDPRAANLHWFKDARFGMFIHYGLYSLLGKGEWVQLFDTIPVDKYARLKDRFDARGFDADAIVKLAKKAGMKYITMTAKHHDGFCLFRTAQTDFNSVNAAAGRDLVGEMAIACEKEGLGLFLYYSYAADWHHPYFYPREEGWEDARPAYKIKPEEYKYKGPADFRKYVDYVHNQIRELLTQYPTIAGIWFDPIMGYYAAPGLFPIHETYSLIRGLSPHALISFKQGANGEEDFVAPERNAGAKAGGLKGIAAVVYEKNKDKPKEVCNTMQPLLPGMKGGSSWGYNKGADGHHLRKEDVRRLLKSADAGHYNLLLNIGPLPDGAVQPEDIEALSNLNEGKGHTQRRAGSHPNIVYIMADDLGFGDLHCYNKDGRIPTPNVDELAAKGVVFSNAHSSDALCTPSRYSILTGRYCWRTKLKKGVIFDYSQPLIEDSIMTIAQFLKGAGYHTAAFGKWHQGFDWRTTDGKETPFKVSSLYIKNIDFKRDFKNGPLDHGFDYYFGSPGSNDMGPYLYIENRRVVGEPTIWATKENFPMMRGKRETWMTRGYKLSQLDSNFTERAKGFIRKQDKKTPFFVYFAASAPHYPYDVPAYAKGKSKAGARGDMVYVFDHMVGELVKTLKEQGLYENTVIIIASDNGPLPGVAPSGTVPDDGIFETYGHQSTGDFKGFKGNVFEGGHRVPLIVSWPGRAVGGKKIEQEVCLVDIFGLIGQIIDRDVPATAKDSYGFLPLVTEQHPSFKRKEPIISYAGGVYSVQGFDGWKYVHENKLGGGIFPWKAKGIVVDPVGPVQGSAGMLYNLNNDPGEEHDLYKLYPDKVRALTDIIKRIIAK